MKRKECPSCGTSRFYRYAVELSFNVIVVYECKKCGKTFTFFERASKTLHHKEPLKARCKRHGFILGESEQGCDSDCYE